MGKSEFYSLKKIDSKKALYNVIIGQRSNGKTYAVIKRAIENYFKTGARTAYLRRFKEDLTPRNISELLTPHMDLIEKLSRGKWNSIKYFNREFRFVSRNEKGDIIEQDENSIIKCFSLNTWESAKGADNGYFNMIIFDEFLTRGFYLQDEFIIFGNLLSSILRNRDGTIIYMLANTVNKYCPYFAEMGLYNVDKMEQGTIDVYRYGESGLSVAVEYCASSNATKHINKYFAFNNPRLNMVTKGTWEIANYPHCPIKYEKEDIIGHCFVYFNDNLIHAEIVSCIDTTNKSKHLFVFFYNQTKPIEIEDIECMYTDKPDSNILHCHNINDRPTKLHELFIKLLTQHNDYYNTNETGEIIRNWKVQVGLI